jgi:hypothetical protein
MRAQNVKVYVVLYQEVEMALKNASRRAETRLAGLHKNIHVMRHPNKLLGGSTAIFWSHHDKVRLALGRVVMMMIIMMIMGRRRRRREDEEGDETHNDVLSDSDGDVEQSRRIRQ